MVSEDSQELGWLAMVHRLDDRSNVCHSRNREVLALLHETNNLCEFLKVLTLRCSQGIRFEVRDDDIPQIGEPPHIVLTQIFSVVVVATIHVYLAATEEADKLFEHIPTRLALHHVERWLQLPTEPRFRVSEQGAAETAFPVHETGNPSLDPESFLLIFRTSHIVTATQCRRLNRL
jgi:hypothetical protein